jgi:protein HIRA/HIR1
VTSNPFFGDGNNVEHWSRVHSCRGHNLDVVGLAWSPDDTHLVSCSLDKDAPIIVWKLGGRSGTGSGGGAGTGGGGALSTVLHPFKILGRDVHSSCVKGIAFDPIGKYLASSGDDPSVCFWRCTGDWGLEKQLDKSEGIFSECSTTSQNQTLFRRLSFSPDGGHVCVTNGVIRGKNVAAMVSRIQSCWS